MHYEGGLLVLVPWNYLSLTQTHPPENYIRERGGVLAVLPSLGPRSCTPYTSLWEDTLCTHRPHPIVARDAQNNMSIRGRVWIG